MGTIFHLPKSNMFGSFQLLTLPFINHIVKEISTSSTVIISFESYYENLLKALTKERPKVDHLSGQYDVIESTNISNVSNKELLSHQKPKQELNQFLEKKVVNYLKRRLFFCSCCEWRGSY